MNQVGLWKIIILICFLNHSDWSWCVLSAEFFWFSGDPQMPQVPCWYWTSNHETRHCILWGEPSSRIPQSNGYR
jgi:hypothetical protein